MRITRKRVKEAIQTQNEVLRQQEEITMLDAIRRYRQAQNAIQRNINTTLTFILQRIEANEQFTDAMRRLNRLHAFQQQIEDEITKATNPILNRIETNQAFATGYAQETAQQNTFAPSVITSWNALPQEALQDLIGFMSNGKPLHNLLSSISMNTADVVTRKITEGLVLGRNPRIVAAETAKLVDMPLNRLLTITRTEMLRSYRESSRRAYIANTAETGGIVTGWVWHCALDARCCAVCIAMHGTVHSVNERLNGHPNCRCAMVPKTTTWQDLGFNISETVPTIQDGATWFRGQTQGFKQQTLGKSKLELYNSRRIVLDDLIVQKTNPVWGSMRVEASIPQALANAAARKAHLQ